MNKNNKDKPTVEWLRLTIPQLRVFALLWDNRKIWVVLSGHELGVGMRLHRMGLAEYRPIENGFRGKFRLSREGKDFPLTPVTRALAGRM